MFVFMNSSHERAALNTLDSPERSKAKPARGDISQEFLPPRLDRNVRESLGQSSILKQDGAGFVATVAFSAAGNRLRYGGPIACGGMPFGGRR